MLEDGVYNTFRSVIFYVPNDNWQSLNACSGKTRCAFFLYAPLGVLSRV